MRSGVDLHILPSVSHAASIALHTYETLKERFEVGNT